MASKYTCSICLNNFIKPKLLPCCHHTFCEQCIDDYIKAHARFNKFNCPVCRQQTVVPSGGASQFVNNFYLEDDDDDKQYCTKHKKEEIKVYCRDCSKPCCSVCVMVGHENHTKADLDDAESETRQKYLELKARSEKKLKKLQNHADFLKTKMSDINNLCKTACDKVDKHVNNICEKVRKVGEKIKDLTSRHYEYENSKLTKLIEDVDKMTSEMKARREYADRILQHRSIITAVDNHGSADFEIRRNYYVSIDLYSPKITHRCHSMAEVDTDCLKRLFGKLQWSTTTTSSFDLNEIVKPSRDAAIVILICGFPWAVRVEHDISGLYIRLVLETPADITIKAVTASYTLKLLNINDESKSLVEQGTRTFKPGGVYTGVYIGRDKLEDAKNGFIDDNKTFIVETSVYDMDY